MAEEEVGGGGGEREETTISTTMSGSGSVPGSPNNKVKFLCSHGGKILPRPADGHLKYVGGETRVVSVPRDINFSELMKKLASLCEGEVVLKYQLIPEELDALVSVKSDEDLRHMLDEHDRHESTGTPRLRAFLFPAKPIVAEIQVSSMEQPALEQRYIDAVNGIIRVTTTTTSINSRNPSVIVPHSAGSSPESPESCTTDTVNHELMLQPNSSQKSRVGMHRVQSSPTISSLGNQHHSIHHMQQHHHQYYQNHHQLHQQGHLSPRGQLHQQGQLSPRAQHPPERLAAVRSVGRADSWKYQVIPSPTNHYPMARHNRGGGGCYCSKCMRFDEYGAYVDKNISPPPTRSPL